VTGFEDSPEQINESQVPDAPTYAFQEQPMMDSVEVARQITFDDPAAFESEPSCNCILTVRTA